MRPLPGLSEARKLSGSAQELRNRTDVMPRRHHTPPGDYLDAPQNAPNQGSGVRWGPAQFGGSVE